MPVVNVNWHEALAYCRWLEARLGEEARKPERTGALWTGLRSGSLHVTLPSEAEWEKERSGRGREDLPLGERGGSEPCQLRWDRLGERTAVGCFPGGASPAGCEELSGNVWEWTRNLIREYPYDPSDGREDLERPLRKISVCCGAARSAAAPGTSAARSASVKARTTGTTTLDSGLCCPHSPLTSVFSGLC